MTKYALVTAMATVLATGVMGEELAPNTITFDNQSGKAALVKLVGPTAKDIPVPSGTNETVHASAGTYCILVRYGSDPERHTYTRGEPFIVSQTETACSEITITLHKVAHGNYETHPITATDFVVASSTSTNGSAALLIDFERMRKLGEVVATWDKIERLRPLTIDLQKLQQLEKFQRLQNLQKIPDPETLQKLQQLERFQRLQKLQKLPPHIPQQGE